MMGRIALSAIFCLLAQIAAAQTVQVRSGDHDGFTRLVMTLPEGSRWQTETGARTASVIVAQPALVFDTSRVFDRITRARLAGISAPAGQARLDLALACDCSLSASRQGPDLLVLDIADRAAPALNTPQRPRPRPRTITTRKQETSESAAQVAPAARALTQQLDRVFLPVPEPEGHPLRPGNPEMAPPPATVDLGPMHSALVRQLGQAARQGLLTPRHRTPVPSDRTGAATPASPDPVAAETETGPAPIPAAPSQGPAPDIRLHSAIEPTGSLRIVSAPGSEHTPACLPGEWTNVAAWGDDDAPFEAQVGPLLRDLLGEFDRVRPEQALELARLYLYFGFGIEARQVLSLIETRSGETQVMTELAVILEGGVAPEESLLRSQTDCATTAALWSLLRHDRLPDNITFDHDLIQRSFAALPGHLRRLLGPGLARKLAATGHRQTAAGILRSIDRRDPEPTPDRALAAAELAQVNGQTEAAAADFGLAVDSNTTASVEALIEVIEQNLARDQPVPFDRAELAGAYAQQYRGTPLGQRMARAYVAALAASGAFDRADAEFERLKPELRAEDQIDLHNRLAAYLTRDASDLDFLRYTLSSRIGGPEALSPDTALAVSRRLLAAGFADAAAAYLSPPGTGADDSARHLLQADIALARNQPREALVALMTIETPEAELRRGRARSLSGQFDSAITHFAAARAPEALQEAAWMAADWKRLQDSGDPVLRQTADLALSAQMPDAATDSGILARTRHLLEQSTQTRQTFGQLLDARPAPQTQDD